MTKGQISEANLFRLARQLASREREFLAIKGATKSQEIVKHYRLALRKGRLPFGKDGSYDAERRLIILSNQITSVERLKFTFYHELMHHLIREDGELLSYLHDSCTPDQLEIMLERLCQAGAAEFAIPSSHVREYLDHNPFSTLAIPVLCDGFKVSAPAVAYQLVYCAKHECYFVACEPGKGKQNIQQEAFMGQDADGIELRVIYSGKSLGAKYSIARHTTIPHDHLLWAAFRDRTHLSERAMIPFRSGRKWEVYCDALFFRDSVYGFFNVTAPIAPQQLPLL